MTDLAKLANKISYMWKNPINFNTLIGKTIVSIEKDNNVILFTALDNEQYIMFHNQDCCECVEIEEIIGDLNDPKSKLNYFLKNHNCMVIKPHLNTGSKLFYNALTPEVR